MRNIDAQSPSCRLWRGGALGDTERWARETWDDAVQDDAVRGTTRRAL
jgi:hypothetical protein